MRRFLISIIGALAVFYAYATGENVPTSRSYVDSALTPKQDIIERTTGANQVLTNTGTAGEYGTKEIYNSTNAYGAQQDALVDAQTMNEAVQNAIDSEFQCAERIDPNDSTSECILWQLRGETSVQQSYVSATGTYEQNGEPTPTHPINPSFYRQGDMILRRVGTYADSYDATTGKIIRRVGVKVFNGTENVSVNVDSSTGSPNALYTGVRGRVGGMGVELLCSHFKNSEIRKYMTVNIGWSLSVLESYELPDTTTGLKAWLAEQYNAGTPVTVYYPLATPVEENWGETTYNQYLPEGNN